MGLPEAFSAYLPSSIYRVNTGARSRRHNSVFVQTKYTQAKSKSGFTCSLDTFPLNSSP